MPEAAAEEEAATGAEMSESAGAVAFEVVDAEPGQESPGTEEWEHVEQEPAAAGSPWSRQMRWGPGTPGKGEITEVAVEPHPPTSPAREDGRPALTMDDADFSSFVVRYHNPTPTGTPEAAGRAASDASQVTLRMEEAASVLAGIEWPHGPAAQGDAQLLQGAPHDLLNLMDDRQPKHPWSSLGPAMRDAASVLGYEEETWPHHVKDHVGWEEWDELPDGKQAAWRTLGVDESS